VRFLPILVFALLAGLVADLYDRRKILLITQSAMTLIAFALAYLTWQGGIQLWHIYLLTGLQATAVAFDLPARQSLVTNLVPVEDLPNAFSLQSIAFDLGAVVGPALSGVVIASLGQQFTYLFNAVSFLAVIYALLRMDPIAPRPQVDGQAGLAKPRLNLQSIREGIQFIVHQPIILGTMLLDFFVTFFSSANTLLPYVARDVLHVGAIQYGWLSAAQSIGAVATALVLTQQKRIQRQGPLLLGAVFVFGAATVLFGLSRVFWFTMAALILVGAADAVSTIIRNTVRQLLTPDAIRGRMVSINQIFFMGGPQLGEIEAGLAAQFLSTPASIVIGGVGTVLAAIYVLARWPQIRRFDGHEPAPVPAPAS
jgi:MFS family permease